ncbi:unnamed protein product [Oncorhynchus mykiss]|uniref:Uncharacterized protein n=1 Tax=Oncorhynchus mykiss TaxID=8022 RepID=A0A060WA62_ONCMY|nr:unnamed protein product [Oncorhynchus mykiss]
MASGPNASRLEWIRDLHFDPNYPANTKLTELIRACEQRDRATGHFRLHALEEEFDFTTEEQLEKSRHFGLLHLCSTHAVDVSPSNPIPLHNRDITEPMFAVMPFSLLVLFQISLCCLANSYSMVIVMEMFGYTAQTDLGPDGFIK